MPEPTQVLNAAAIRRALTRIAHEIAERNEKSADVVLVGIQRGGVPLAQRLAETLTDIWKHDLVPTSKPSKFLFDRFPKLYAGFASRAKVAVALKVHFGNGIVGIELQSAFEHRTGAG